MIEEQTNSTDKYRIERTKYGFYIVGYGQTIPADDGIEAQMILQLLQKKNEI
jgi:hypothetical protein